MTKISAILFDWDNTLINSWPIIHQSLNKTFQKWGLKQWNLQQVKSRVARSMRDSFPEIFGENWEEAGKDFQNFHRELHLINLEVFTGAEETIKILKNKGIYMAIISNKQGDNLRKEIDYLGWNNYFNIVIGAGDAAQDKPNIAPILKAVAPANILLNKDIWLIGDSKLDMECAKNSNISSILYGDKIHNIDYNLYAKNHKDLQKILNQL